MSGMEDNFGFDKFKLWEAKSRDTIDFKRIYVDMAGDLVAGLLLSQIIYWHLDDRYGETRLRVWKDGHLWIVKQRNEWWNEIRITPKQFDRACGILVGLGILTKTYGRFNGLRTTHVRIVPETFMALWERAIVQRDAPQSPKGQPRNSPKSKTEVDERVRPLTETTTETTTKEPPSVFDSVPKEKPPPTPLPKKPLPQDVYEYQRIDEEPEFKCRCGRTLEIARLSPTRAVCECGAPLRVRDERKYVIVSPPQSARRRESARPGSSFAAGPVNAFCKLIGMQVSDLGTRDRHQWAAIIEKLANGATAQETTASIGAIRGNKDHGWKSYTHPARQVFQDVLPIMLSQSKAGSVNTGGGMPPQGTDAFYERMAEAQSYTGHVMTADQVRAQYAGARRMQEEGL